jgi:ubiquinone/menaquinone biosynthesis C-methylase UbiE
MIRCCIVTKLNEMGLPFDHIASTHDPIFARSAVGQLQRKRVWTYIEKVIPQLQGFEMLELNCGNGDDALMFNDRDCNIVATDIGSEMLKVTFRKAEQYSMQNRISAHYLDLDTFDETLFDKKFDLVFSNFGGMNCINPESIKMLLNKVAAILNPGGRFIGLIMPKFCAWETVFFMLRFQMKKAFRRMTSKEVLTTMKGIDLKTWYYNPVQIKNWSKENFKLVTINPIGVALPPSYLEEFFEFRKRLLLRLDHIEKRFSDMSLFAGMSDYYMIDLQLKS